MLLLFKYQEGIQYCKVPIQTQARAADFSRPLKAESTGAAWCCHPPALIDEVTEHGLHLLFRRLLWDLDQLPHFIYAFFLKTDHRTVGPVVETRDGHIPEITVACLSLWVLRGRRSPLTFLSLAWNHCGIPTLSPPFPWVQMSLTVLLRAIESQIHSYLTKQHSVSPNLWKTWYHEKYFPILNFIHNYKRFQSQYLSHL